MQIPFPLQLFMKYFWFLVTIINLYSLYLSKIKIRKILAGQLAEVREMRGLEKFLYATYIAPFLLMGVWQVLGGYINPLYIFFVGRNNIFSMLSWTTLIINIVYSWYWICFRGGARAFALVNPASLSGLEMNVTGAKILYSFMLFITVGAFVAGVLLGYFEQIPVMFK